MTTQTRKRLPFWVLQGPAWFLFIWLIYAQGITAFGYERGVRMGTQESAESITEVGAAFWYGFAFGDLLIYIPILFLGLIGHYRGRHWGNTMLAAALGITVYWPVVSLATLVDARNATGWELASEAPYWTVCLIVTVWGAWGLSSLMRGIPKKRETPD